MLMYPLIFNADYKERVWGGQKLQTFFNKDIPYEHTGESWEIACHDNGNSVINNGELKGLTLKEAINKYPMEIVGEDITDAYKFPLLIKLIDAKEKLSVQVHPDDSYAMRVENGELGKSEAWYILDAEEGAKLVAGLKEGVDKAAFKKAIDEKRVEEVLNEVAVKKGDVIDIPAGFVHAIGNGIVLAEIQQNSDTTYRVYDWNRVGLDGKPRDLHVAKSLEVIDFDRDPSESITRGTEVKKDGYRHINYVKNEYFSFEKLMIDEQYIEKDKPNRFEIFICIDGIGEIICGDTIYTISKGDSLLVPASVKTFTIKGKEGLEVIKTYVPNLAV